MTRKRRPDRPTRDRRGSVRPALAVRRSENGWEIVHPRCAQERAEDLEEVDAMIAAGELEIAAEELRWLLEGCHDFVAAHRRLGEIALLHQDWALARGHFGYAWDLGRRALAGVAGPVPYAAGGNAPFLEAGRGLAECLHKLGLHAQAIEVLEHCVQMDASDPLGCRKAAAEYRAAQRAGRGASLPVIERPE